MLTIIPITKITYLNIFSSAKHVENLNNQFEMVYERDKRHKYAHYSN